MSFTDNPLTREELAWQLVELFDELRIEQLNEMFAKNVPMEMLEFFASGLPVVTTSVGARGLAVRDGEHLCVVEREEFAEKLRALLGDETLCPTPSGTCTN